MKYFSTKELNAEKKEEAIERLSKFSGPMVRLGSALNIFKKHRKEHLLDKNIKILDCGAASGGFLKQLKESGYENIYGTDLDDYLAPENKTIPTDFKTVDLSYEKLPWQDNFFNVLTAWCLVPHLENPYNFFREAKRVLKPNGLLIISLINISSRPNRKFFLRHGNFPGYHKNNNHIAVLPPAVFEKTVFRDFELKASEYFINPRIFEGFKGGVRKLIFRLASNFNFLKNILEDRWAPKIVYILKRK